MITLRNLITRLTSTPEKKTTAIALPLLIATLSFGTSLSLLPIIGLTIAGGMLTYSATATISYFIDLASAVLRIVQGIETLVEDAKKTNQAVHSLVEDTKKETQKTNHAVCALLKRTEQTEISLAQRLYTILQPSFPQEKVLQLTHENVEKLDSLQGNVNKITRIWSALNEARTEFLNCLNTHSISKENLAKLNPKLVELQNKLDEWDEKIEQNKYRFALLKAEMSEMEKEALTDKYAAYQNLSVALRLENDIVTALCALLSEQNIEVAEALLNDFQGFFKVAKSLLIEQSDESNEDFVKFRGYFPENNPITALQASLNAQPREAITLFGTLFEKAESALKANRGSLNFSLEQTNLLLENLNQKTLKKINDTLLTKSEALLESAQRTVEKSNGRFFGLLTSSSQTPKK